ncbi:hypothetical protein NECAME_15415 [Necator americanus]|uniref:Uncharacterized protein n=1 Tax=Necator americanus TaxID=51031 RepID=W2SI92_NECAM|nr:hypothetical protein NECAME_15415 [Necator americanus]ETN69268.1 hypothetical protein NECAME_15415 [Necator americanus]
MRELVKQLKLMMMPAIVMMIPAVLLNDPRHQREVNLSIISLSSPPSPARTGFAAFVCFRKPRCRTRI